MTRASRLSLALDVAEELEEVKRLPRHVPGKVIVLTLDQLPDYLAINGLQPSGAKSAEGVLLVEKESEG